MHVVILPPHHDLDDVVKLAEGAIVNLNPPPNWRLHPNQCNLKLEKEIGRARRLLTDLWGLQAEDARLFLFEKLGGFLLDRNQPFLVGAEGIVSGLGGFVVQVI